eukprot:CAMPEP_0181134314 /NCGR_PEP_ID=MMETSP1071-20121207/32024_1 /TAXON_ID=35127 /ORGANISM="Thalassiosira sp., Strain NH16" /LENGTH=337 /DNA_ID=CAMNT_0023220829 /DNA_START=55 /DNA_END=1068 /DNA_ORIENTATION=-
MDDDDTDITNNNEPTPGGASTVVGAEEIVPGTQLSQANDDDMDVEPATPVPSRRSVFSTPSRQIASAAASDVEGGRTAAAAETPAAALAMAERGEADDDDDEYAMMAEEVLGSVRKTRQSVGDDDDDDDEDDEADAVKTTTVASSSASSSAPAPPVVAAKDAAPAATSSTPASSLPGEPDMTSGNISTNPAPNDSSDTLTSDVRVVVTSTYRPERSDAKLDKHCFAYNVRITNESKASQSIQLVSRRFEIQTVGSANKDVVQGPGVTGRQPVLKPGESFEYTSTAPLSVRPMADKTKVVARMSGEYNFVQLAEDGKTPLSSTPLKAELGAFHFILPE